jgi:hypothetical protein
MSILKIHPNLIDPVNASDGDVLRYSTANGVIELGADGSANDYTTYTTLTSDYSANDYNTYTTLQSEYATAMAKAQEAIELSIIFS